MDNEMISKAIQWVQSNVGERTSKQELSDKVEGSNQPPEVRDAIRELPSGEHSKQDVISQLQQKLTSKMGAGTGIPGM